MSWHRASLYTARLARCCGLTPTHSIGKARGPILCDDADAAGGEVRSEIAAEGEQRRRGGMAAIGGRIPAGRERRGVFGGDRGNGLTAMVASSHSKASDVLLLDTNILIVYAREGEPHRRLESQLGLEDGRAQGIISVISVGEILAFAGKRGWGDKRRVAMMDLVRTQLVPVDINRTEIIAAYADIDFFSEKVVKPARPMGQNDMWIAATSHVLNCELVTMDKDFDHLHGEKLRRRWIDPNSLNPKKA